MLVVGGGQIVDTIRDLDILHGLGQEVAHSLAIRAMDLTAHLTASIVPGLTVVDSMESLQQAWDLQETPIFAPRCFLEMDDETSSDPLPHHWNVTSDSIAARLAVRLGVEELILLKSIDATVGIEDRTQAAARGLVDNAFPDVSRPLSRVSFLNLRSPDAKPTYLH